MTGATDATSGTGAARGTGAASGTGAARGTGAASGIGGRVAPDLRLFGFAAGVWGASIAVLWVRPGVAVIIALAGALVAALTAVGRPTRLIGGSGRVIGLAVAGLALGVVAGAASTAARTAQRDAPALATLAAQRTRVAAELTVTGDPRRLATGSWLIPARLTRVDDLRLSVDVIVFGDDGWHGLLPSQRLATDARLGPPRRVGDLTAATLSPVGAPTLIGDPSWAQRAAGSLRAGLRAACAALPAGPRGLLPGLVIGDTSGLDPGVQDEFRTTGLTHLLAVSGANVAIVVGVVLFLARWSRAGPVTSAVLCGIALVGFVILVRPSASVVRAAAMGTLGLLSLASGRPRITTAALATAVIAGLVYDPALATDAGFALSVAATLALVLLAPRWRDALKRRGVPGGLAEAVAIPAAAQLACGPIIVALSGQVSLVAVPANLLAVPVVPTTTLLGVGATLLAPVWAGGAGVLVWLAQWPARWLLLVAHDGSIVPGGAVGWPAGLGGALLLALVTAVALGASRHRVGRAVLLVTALAAALGAAPVRLLTGGWPPAGTIIVACDVGQGDGLVLPTGPGEAVVVDTGPDPSLMDACLRRLGVSTIPLLVLTHYHQDHVGGIAGAVRGRRVGLVAVGPLREPTGGVHLVEEATAGLPVAEVGPGWSFARGGLTLLALGPVQRLTGTDSDPNNNSIVLRAQAAGEAILLLGDAEVQEQQTLTSLDPAELRADILKVAHHGSAYQDPDLLALVAPRVALVSVGLDNPYGHPNAPLLAKISRDGARVLRTDQDGDLAVAVTARGLAVATRGK